ncbi:MAG: hypothetical protein QNK23_08625 [Crocinitomicaceae bacterium]|nr:hypothetical protein [Crocinitomicaceae bacterium]
MKQNILVLFLSITFCFICSEVYSQRTDTIIKVFDSWIEPIFFNQRKKKRYFKKNPRTSNITTCIAQTNMYIFDYRDSTNRSLKDRSSPICSINETDSVYLIQFLEDQYSIHPFCVEFQSLGFDIYEVILNDLGSVETINHVRKSFCSEQFEIVEQILALTNSINYYGEGLRSFRIAIIGSITCSSEDVINP